MILQLMNIVGAACILGAFVALQTKKLDRDSWGFNLLNVIGSVLLGTVAVFDHRYGWIVMETVWTAVSIRALYRALRLRLHLWTIRPTTQL